MIREPSTALPVVVASSDLSGFHPLLSGDDAFTSRIAAARSAKISLDLQYYIWNNDLTGKLLMGEILAAADRGVRVRMLLDDLNEGQYEKILRILDVHPNIEVRMANPFVNRTFRIFELFRLSEIDRRMHNKLFIADNKVAIVGGRNIGDEYFWASNVVNFGDLDLWAIGPVVHELSEEFDVYWNSDISYPIASLLPYFEPDNASLKEFRISIDKATQESASTPYAKALNDSEMIGHFMTGDVTKFWGHARAIYDPPQKFKQALKDQRQNLHHQLHAYTADAQKDIFMVSPYFIPGGASVQRLENKIKQGVKITVLTNSLASSDVPTVFSGYKNYRKDLIKAGVELFELRPDMDKELKKKSRKLGASGSHSGLHGKTFIFDGRYIFVGSMNLDPRSATLNSEMGVMVDCPEMASYFEERLRKALPERAYHVTLDSAEKLQWTMEDHGQKIQLHQEPDTSWWQRFKASFLSTFIPESEL